MFLDVSSRETFKSPVTDLMKITNLRGPVARIFGQQGHTLPRADVLCYYITHSPVRLRFRGQGGRSLQHTSVDLQPRDLQCMLGSSVYCIESLQNRNEGLGVAPTLTEMRFHQEAGTNAEIFVHDIDPEMQEVKTVADRLLLVRSYGLRVLNPETMMPERLLHNPDSPCQCPLSDDILTLLINPIRVSVLAEKTVLSPTEPPTVMVPVAVNDYFLMLAIQERCAVADPVVEIAFCVKVPGHITEVCVIGQIVGYLISTSFHHSHDTWCYRETVCHLSPCGQLLSILPCLGPGPRSFCPVLLPPPPTKLGEMAEGRPEHATWHVYMRDGHEGIIAVRL